ncbi:MAG: acyl-CoA thioesterase [Candidatus Omnitrophica bacterium]|nr:acyl-CoA thioesterase [Candidatus Omnitrophota bacterium]
MKYYHKDIRIRYAETDQMGVCYYGNYFVWFEVSRTEYFRELGFPYTEYEKKGIFLPVGEAYCRYHKSLKYDDLITVTVWISKLKRTSMQFSYIITKKGEKEPVAEGHTTHVFVNRDMKPCRIPEEIRKNITVVEGVK